MADNLPVLAPQSLSEALKYGEVVAQSRRFADSPNAAQAVVKIMAGAELGVPPIQAMTGIHIVEGRPSLSAQLMASLILRTGHYRYRVVQRDDDACVLAWQEREGGAWVSLGPEIGFTAQEAGRAGLLNRANWKSYRSDMLFARALSRGAKTYCPHVLGGAVHEDEVEYQQPAQVLALPVADTSSVQQRIDAAVAAAPAAPTPEDVVVQPATPVEPAPPAGGTEGGPEAPAVPPATDGGGEPPPPATPPAEPVNQPDPVRAATPAQRRKIHAKASEVGLAHEELRKLLKAEAGVGDTERLPAGKVDAVLAAIEALRVQAAAEPPAAGAVCDVDGCDFDAVPETGRCFQHSTGGA